MSLAALLYSPVPFAPVVVVWYLRVRGVPLAVIVSPALPALAWPDLLLWASEEGLVRPIPGAEPSVPLEP